MSELCYLTIAEAGELIRSKRLSPVELVQAHIERIEALNPVLDAFLLRTTELALQQARQAETEIAAGHWRGPLHGIPFGLKDMFETAGILTTAQSRILANYVPTHDATVTAKLYAAGAVLMGKLATHEFAHGGPSFDLSRPPARNPWNTGHFTGGSSSGSGAAVAAGLVAGALGTDTGGSIRNPSFLCGIVGLKPTFGRVSRTGVIPFSESCDHVGPMTRTVRDAALMLDVLEGHDARDRASVAAAPSRALAGLDKGVKGLRIGFLRHFSEEDQTCDAELRGAVDAALEVFRQLGAEVEETRVRSINDYYAVRIMMSEPELFSLHQKTLQTRTGEYGHHFLSRCLPACLFTASDYVNALRERGRMLAELEPVYQRYDALISVGNGPAPSLAQHHALGSVDKWLKPSIGAFCSVTGAPALAICAGFSQSGLPLGMQIMGRPWEEAMLLRIAHAYEQATPWHQRHPEVSRAGRDATHIDLEPHGAAKIDEAYRAHAAIAAGRAGFDLSDQHMAILIESTPYALALADRVPRQFSYTDEMAPVFSLPGWPHPR